MEKQEIILTLIESERKYGLPILLDYVFGKDINIKIGLSLNDCEKSIDELNLSVRSQNALKRAAIMTLGVLIERLNEGSIKEIRNLGRKSYSEIQTKILVYSYERLSEKEKHDFFDILISMNQ